ncbi:hypothetical protein HOK00_02275 [bacterium]|jgi:hypothetical protein|nr:hypothetical protein [bacterium]
MSYRLISKVILFLLPLPIFMGLSFNIYKGSGYDAANVLPISFFLVSIVGIIYIKKSFMINRLDKLIILNLFFMIIGYSYILITSRSIVSFDWLILYSVPMVMGYFYGRNIAKYIDVNTFLKYIIYSIGLISFLHVVWSIGNYGIFYAIANRGSDDVFGIFSIYQKLISYPLILGIVFFLVLFSKNTINNKLLKYGISLFIFLDLIIVAAREPFAMLFFMFFLYFIKNFTLRNILKVVFFIVIFLILFMIINISFDLSELYIYRKFYVFFNPENDFQATGGRLANFINFWNYISQLNLFFGEGFNITDVRGSAHNQWLDLLTKGGLTYYLSILLIFIHAIYFGFKLRLINKNYLLYSIVLIALIFISFNINTALRTPFTSVLIWVFIGYLSGSYSNYRKIGIKNNKREYI